MPFSCRAFLAHCAVALLCSLFATASARAQPAASTARVAVFLDCGFECDQDFLRTEITFVDWVRDRTAADVHILVTSQRTGGGGREFTLAFLGQRRFAGVGDTLQLVTAQGSTDDETRRGVGRTLRLGLVPFLVRTSLADRLDLTVAAAATGTTATAAPAGRDRWNAWVFTVGANGNLNGEQSSSFRSVSGNVMARRITEEWKLSFRAWENYHRSVFDLGDSRTVFVRRSTTLSQLAVRSLGPRLSAGLRSSLGSSTFENKRFFYRLTPAVEYDVFPYSESTRRMLTVQYAAGVESFDYREETIYFRTQETRPIHTLEVSLSQNQPWGSVDASLEGGQYLDDTNKNFASVSGGTSVRLFRGLNFNVSGRFASIHNQIYIPRRGATEQEILTQQRRLETSYSYFGFFGLSYTFGSLLNNVVNPRFGGGEGGRSCFCF